MNPSAAADKSAPAIRFRNVRKRFGRRWALGGIDLELDSGQIVGIVGPDGAGKTTLLRSVAGLLEIEADEATVLGHDLRDDVTELKAKIGYVPQSFSLHRDLSVWENLRFTARLHRIPEIEFHRRVEELLERTGLSPFAERMAGALSGGMKQKLAVVNALLPEPQLLVLDEPTAGVDVVARAEIGEMLERERTRALILLSTSYLDEADGCDRLAYLEAGRLVATGTPAELRSAVELRVYRAWGDDTRAIAREAKRLPYVEAARATRRFVRIETRPDADPTRTAADLRSLSGASVDLLESVDVDMETTLLALSRRSGAVVARTGTSS